MESTCLEGENRYQFAVLVGFSRFGETEGQVEMPGHFVTWNETRLDVSSGPKRLASQQLYRFAQCGTA